jgi:lipopolysaccharide transport protein LptA
MSPPLVYKFSKILNSLERYTFREKDAILFLVQPNLKLVKDSQLQSFLLLGLAIFFLAHFMLLSPSSLEDDFTGVRVVHPKDLLSFLQNESETIAKIVPTTVVPDYSIRDLNYYASSETEKNWRLQARKANMYQKDQLMHTRDMTLTLQDGTVVTAKEGVLHTETNEMEFFGNVNTYFTNGTHTVSEYGKALTKPVIDISVPLTEWVHGDKTDAHSRVEFKSMGLSYVETGAKDLKLLSEVEFNVFTDKKTRIVSDYAVYDQIHNRGTFSMNDQRPLDQQFAQVFQSDMYLKSRTLVMNLGDQRQLLTIVAIDDAYLRDSKDPLHVSTGTAGKATYYDLSDEVYLTDFPQVYQDSDTITGDLIIFHRKQDVVEAKQSNAIYKK